MSEEDILIQVDSDIGKGLGFTSDIFDTHSFLFQCEGNEIWISFIEIKKELRGKGHFSKLLKTLEQRYSLICIPTPMPNMEMIALKKGFIYTTQYDEKIQEDIDVWKKVGRV